MAPDFAYGHTYGLRQLRGEPTPLTEEEAGGRPPRPHMIASPGTTPSELPEEVDARLGELEAALEAFDTRPLAFDPAEVGRAGAFVSIAQDGKLRVERGYGRPEDEVPVEEEHATSTETDDANHVASASLREAATPVPLLSPRRKTDSPRSPTGCSRS